MLKPLALICFLAAFSSAATINFTFKAITADVTYNGTSATNIDLSVDLLANTNDLVAGGGWFNSDRYLNLKAFVSSKALGLSNMEATTPLEVHIGGPASEPLFRNSTAAMVLNGTICGIFNMKAIENWNRVTSIGPLLGPATSSAPLRIVLKNGAILSIITLEVAQPYGNASFQAHIVPDVFLTQTSAPVDGSLRKLGEKDLYLETKSNAVVRFRLLAKTQFQDQQGAAIRDSLLHPGDRLSVIVNPDDPETAVGVVLIRK